MRDTLFPPPRLFGSAAFGTTPGVRRVHEICNKAVWASLGIRGRLWAGFLALTWPVAASAVAIHWLRRNGVAIRTLAGKSLLRQFVEMLHLAMRYRITCKYYYAFEFYNDAHRSRAGDYLMRYETKEIAYRLLYPKNPITSIKDKIGFAAYCREHDLPAAPLIAVFKDGARVMEAGSDRLPEGDIFLKPGMSKGGWGAERWNWIGGGNYRSTRGPELSGDALLEHVAKLSHGKPFLMQPAFSNHADIRDLSLGALCTARVLTCRNEQGGHEVVGAAFRMSMNAKSAVDNFHAGGIAACVDLATGRLGPASGLGLGPNFEWYDRHPLTGAQIAGRILPCWSAVMALAVRAHDVFSEWVVVGWDIAMLDDGPCLIEGNKGADIDIIQRTGRGPIGAGRFGTMLAHQLEQVTKR